MGEAQLPAGTLTFFFSDVEGSTRAATALGAAFAPALEQHRRAVRAALAEAGGREVSTAGDSFFAVFPDAAAALQAAVAVQRAAALAGGFRTRIGIHAGQAVLVGDDYIGLDVHRASRIADAGHGGQILVSDAALAALPSDLGDGLRLRDLGRHRLKDVGPVRLWEVHGDGLPPGPFPPPRSLEAHPTNLPAAGGPLLGREVELAELADLIERSSVVTVTGPGGIGKSRLAIEVARSLVERFPDGVFHLDLASTPDASAAVGALGDVLGFRGPGEEPALPALLDRLRDRDLLFVLDTADRVTGLPGLLAAVASACRRIRILVSSRSRLRIAAEREYPVGPLAADAAVELFARRAADVHAGFALDDRNRDPVERLVGRLDRIPLAIELAAARVRLFSPAALLDRLERRLPALGEGGADAPDRQRTLEAAIAWSCELLSPAEQSAFAQLGAFAGSFDLAAVEAVIEGNDGADPVTVLEQLVDRSLVVADARGQADRAGAAEGPRFRLLGPIREFAAAALRQEGSEGPVRDRHARHFLDVARPDTQTLGGDAELEAIARLGLGESEFRAALDWCQDEGADPDRAAVGFELAARLGRYWHVRGQVTEGLARLTRYLALDIDVPPEIRARALPWAGVLHDDAGQTEDASRLLDEALTLRRQLGDDVEVARILNSLGVVARSMGDLPRAEQLLQESLQRKATLGDRRGTAVSLSNLGLVAADQGRTDAAVDLLRRALEIDEEIGGTSVIISSANLGAALIRAGRHEEGLAQIRRALPGIAELADPELVIEALVATAEAAHATMPALREPSEAAPTGGGVASGGNAAPAAEHGGHAGPAAEPWAARLLFAADRIRDTARVRLHDADRRYLADLRARVLAGVDPERLRSLEGQAAAVDVDAGLALARQAMEQLAPG